MMRFLVHALILLFLVYFSNSVVISDNTGYEGHEHDGVDDNRPRVLHPIVSQALTAIIGRRTNPDDRLEWLLNKFPRATLRHYNISGGAHLFFTANEHTVAAWAFKGKITVADAVRMTNATVHPNAFGDVDVAGMREVVEVDSLSAALGVIRHLRFDDEVEDGYLLMLNPGLALEVTAESPGIRTIPTSTISSLGPCAPTSEEAAYLVSPKKSKERCNISSGYSASLTVGVILLVVLIGMVVVLANQRTRKHLLGFVETRLYRRERRGEALLNGVRYEADSESVSVDP